MGPIIVIIISSTLVVVMSLGVLICIMRWCFPEYEERWNTRKALARPCVACEYYVDESTEPTCSHPDTGKVNLVTGESKKVTCELTRLMTGCDRTGKLFKKRVDE